MIYSKKERQAVAKKKEQDTHFRYNMIKSFQRDPLLCECGEIMIYIETYDPLEDGIKNDRRYRDRYIFESKYLKKRKNQIIKYTDEELEMLIEDDVMIEMKCPSCGYEEEVPDWILEEFLEMELERGKTNRRYSC